MFLISSTRKIIPTILRQKKHQSLHRFLPYVEETTVARSLYCSSTTNYSIGLDLYNSNRKNDMKGAVFSLYGCYSLGYVQNEEEAFSVARRYFSSSSITQSQEELEEVKEEEEEEEAGAVETAAANNNENIPESPLELIHSARATIESFGKRLQTLQDKMTRDIILPSGQSVSLKDIVLHSRDASVEDFQKPEAATARSIVLNVAESIEKEMKQLAQDYVSTVVPAMSNATVICKDLNCGGASFEIDFANAVGKQIRIEGKETPCGKLHTASVNFLELSYTTKHDMILGSRSAYIVRLATEFNVPLRHIRENGTDQQKQQLFETFNKENVPTPWIRTEQEYKQFFQQKKEAEEGEQGSAGAAAAAATATAAETTTATTTTTTN